MIKLCQVLGSNFCSNVFTDFLLISKDSLVITFVIRHLPQQFLVDANWMPCSNFKMNHRNRFWILCKKDFLCNLN
jgi:hypothetical protein